MPSSPSSSMIVILWFACRRRRRASVGDVSGSGALAAHVPRARPAAQTRSLAPLARERQLVLLLEQATWAHFAAHPATQRL